MKLTEQNVKQLIIDDSMKKAVFVYFYANSPECEAATKALRAAISDGNQYISLVEADIQEQVGQAIAMQLGLRSVPALVVMQNGQPVDALQGDDVTAKLQETMNKFMPSQAELLMRDALACEASGDLSLALIKAKEAYGSDEKNQSFKMILARLYIKNKDFADAHKLLDNPGREEQNLQEYKDLISSLTLAEQAADSPELKELEAKHRAAPDDKEITVKLAAALSDAGKRKEALEMLFDILKKDLSDQDIKKTFLDILSTMAGDPLQKEYRRKLYALMY